MMDNIIKPCPCGDNDGNPCSLQGCPYPMRTLGRSLEDHRRRQACFCRITFYRKTSDGPVMCRETDDWATCTVGPLHGSLGAQSFTTAETYHRDRLLALLEHAFNLGRADKARDIRNVLEIGA